MSHDANKWEAEVRQVVETHEFGYDPEAWAAMEQMLDGAGGAPGAPSGAIGVWSGWKILLPLLLVTGGLLLWWYWPIAKNTPPAPARKEAVTPPDSLRELSVAPGKAMDSPAASTDAGPQRKERRSAPLKEMAPLAPLPTVESAPFPLPLREEVLRLRWKAPPFLPVEPPRLLVPPDTLSPALEVQAPDSGKRRRNRKTLFPDVIEKY